jgi:hypothetical protein
VFPGKRIYKGIYDRRWDILVEKLKSLFLLAWMGIENENFFFFFF